MLIEDEELELKCEEEDYRNLLIGLGMTDKKSFYINCEDKKHELEISYYPLKNIWDLKHIKEVKLMNKLIRIQYYL